MKKFFNEPEIDVLRFDILESITDDVYKDQLSGTFGNEDYEGEW